MHSLAEAAPRVGHDHTHLIVAHAEGAGQPRAIDVGGLGAGPDGQPLAFPRGNQTARLERRGGRAGVGEGLPHHEMRPRERSLDVAVTMGCK